MPNPALQRSSSDRVEVFVSSTIGECKKEREAALRAITALNFTAILFEREGARAETPRALYLRKLYPAHFVVAIYKSSYGWIDEKKGMTISGLEDEFREARRWGKDLLIYALKSETGRDKRLTELLEEIKEGPYTVYFFDENEDLEGRIRDDLTTLVAQRVTGAQSAQSSSLASDVLAAIYRGSAVRVRRADLLEKVSAAAAISRVVWLTGESGAGKTALAAEWASERGAAYVNAKGLTPQTILVEMARTLNLADGVDLAVPVFEDAKALLLSRWKDGSNWPIVIDDPDDIEAIWPVLNQCLASSSQGSVVIICKQFDEKRGGFRVEVGGFSSQELEAFRVIAGESGSGITAGELPIEVRRASEAVPIAQKYDELPAQAREAIGYIALCPTPLTLNDLVTLLGHAVKSPTELTDYLQHTTDLVVESPAGYALVHDIYRDEISKILDGRLQLRSLLSDRLTKRLAKTGRAWAAFAIYRGESSEKAQRLANLTVREAIFSGSIRHLLTALEFLAGYYRSRGEKALLTSVLISLADTLANHGRASEAPELIKEALDIAQEIGDEEAQQTLEILQACLALRQSMSQEALARMRQLRRNADAEGREKDAARLLLEEGVALLSANETAAAVEVFRKSREAFVKLQDDHGVEVSTRNLIISLAGTPNGIAESDLLRSELEEGEVQSPRYRAWLCNLLVPRLRRAGRFAEAEQMAREAISIGKDLGDSCVVAINTMVLGNVLREEGREQEAIDLYMAAGRLANEVRRPDIDGRSSRLLALTENTLAERATGSERVEHARRAEAFASHASAIFADSFGWSEYGYAKEELGDARRLLGRDEEAKQDYSEAIAGFLKGNDEAEVERLLRYLIAKLDEEPGSLAIMAKAFQVNMDKVDGSGALWVKVMAAVMSVCPLTSMPRAIGFLVRIFLPHEKDSWWFECLVRGLLQVERARMPIEPPEAGPLLLVAVLAYSRHRSFTVQQLMVLAGLCLNSKHASIIRYKPGDDFVQIVHLGHRQQVLFTIRDEAKRPEATFVAMAIGSFLSAFGDDISALILGGDSSNGAAIDVTVFAQAAESPELAAFMDEGLSSTPVATARIDPGPNEETPVVVLARRDAMELLQSTPERAGEMQIMLARFLDAVLHKTVGGSIDDEIYKDKIKELLIRVLG